MKDMAIGLLLVVLVSFLTEPLIDAANVYRQTVIVGSAITNSCRAAKNTSLIYEDMINVDAKVDKDLFIDNFSEAFEQAMNMTEKSKSGTKLVFGPNDDNYNDFTVNLEFSSETDYDTEQTISKVNVHAESNYKFITKYLKQVEASSDAVTLKIKSNRTLLLSVRN